MANKRIRKKRAKQTAAPLRCALCGRKLIPGQVGYVSGFHGMGVCHQCVRASYAMTKPKQDKTTAVPSASKDRQLLTPQILQAELGKRIAGQPEAKRTVSLAMWKQGLRAAGNQDVPTSHLLLYGPTGCGKTMLASRAAELSGLPWCVFDSTTLTETGYRGRDAVDILKDYLAATKGHPAQPYGVIILDEIDKLAAEGFDERKAYCRGTQRTLFKMLEGSVVPVDGRQIDTSKLLFVLCGVFAGVQQEKPRAVRPIGFLPQETVPTRQPEVGPEDFVRCGMEPELMGRIADISPIHQLTAVDLTNILTKAEGSAFRQYQTFFASRGVELTLPHHAAEEIARRTLALGTGARGLKSELDKVMELLMLSLAEGQLNGKVEVPDGLPALCEAVG